MMMNRLVMDPLQRQLLVDAVVAVIFAMTADDIEYEEKKEPEGGESTTVR